MQPGGAGGTVGRLVCSLNALPTFRLKQHEWASHRGPAHGLPSQEDLSKLSAPSMAAIGALQPTPNVPPPAASCTTCLLSATSRWHQGSRPFFEQNTTVVSHHFETKVTPGRGYAHQLLKSLPLWGAAAPSAVPKSCSAGSRAAAPGRPWTADSAAREHSIGRFQIDCGDFGLGQT